MLTTIATTAGIAFSVVLAALIVISKAALTDRGRTLREELPDVLDQVAGRALPGMADAERARLVTLLRRVAANLRATQPDDCPGA